MATDEYVDLAAQFVDADAVVVTDNLNNRLADAAQPASVDAVRAVLAELSDGWHVPVGGVPVAIVRLNFRCGDRPLGSVGVASTFLTAHVHGTFRTRRGDPDVAGRLLDAVAAGHLRDQL